MEPEELKIGKRGQYRLLNSITPIFFATLFIFTLMLLQSEKENFYQAKDMNVLLIIAYSLILVIILTSLFYILTLSKENVKKKRVTLENFGPLLFLLALIIGSVFATLGYSLSLMIDNFCYFHFLMVLGLWIFIILWIGNDNRKYHVRKWFKIYHLLDMEALGQDD